VKVQEEADAVTKMQNRKMKDSVEDPFKEFDARIKEIEEYKFLEEEKKVIEDKIKLNQTKEEEIDPKSLRISKIPPGTTKEEIQELFEDKYDAIRVHVVEDRK